MPRRRRHASTFPIHQCSFLVSAQPRLGFTVQVIKRLEAGIGSVRTLLAVMAVLEFRLSGLGAGLTLAEQLRGMRQKRYLTLEELSRRTGIWAVEGE